MATAHDRPRPHSIFSVRDFGYAPTDQLHYGPTDDDADDTNTVHRASHLPSTHRFSDGPPWLQDHDTPTTSTGHAHHDADDTDDGEIHGKAIALFDFEPENDNEVGLSEGQLIWISYRHGQGWLVAEDAHGETGLVPEEYVQLLPLDDDHQNEFPQQQHEEGQELPTQMLPELLKPPHSKAQDDHDSDWIDEDDEEMPAVEKLELK